MNNASVIPGIDKNEYSFFWVGTPQDIYAARSIEELRVTYDSIEPDITAGNWGTLSPDSTVELSEGFQSRLGDTEVYDLPCELTSSYIA